MLTGGMVPIRHLVYQVQALYALTHLLGGNHETRENTVFIPVQLRTVTYLLSRCEPV
jgi:hypothetical protein